MDAGREDLYRLLAGRGEHEANERVRESLRDPDSPLHGFLENYCAVSARALDVAVVGQILRRRHYSEPGQENPLASESVDSRERSETGGPIGRGRWWGATGRGYRLAMRAALVFLVIGMMGASGAALAWKSRLDRLEKEINNLGLTKPVRFDEPKVFVNAGRNRVSVAGSANESYVRRVLVTWDENQPSVTIYEGPSEPPPGGLYRPFSALSPEFELDYRIVTPTLTIEPYVGIESKFSQFFKHTSVSRSFLFSMDGIIPDPDNATARSPLWLKIPSRPIRLRANDPGYEFGGVSRRDGWAVVLIREDRPSGPWYVQNFGQPIRVEPGKPFTVPCTLAPEVEHFEVKAVLLQSLEKSPFAEQKEFLTIPTYDAKGQRMESTEAVKFSVIRRGSTSADIPGERTESVDAAEILTPRPESTVGRIEILEGRTKIPGHPVVLVMPEVAGQPWIVQPSVALVGDDGAFTTRVYFGDASTKRTKYHIVIVLAKDKMTAESYTEGMEIKTLPLYLPQSKPVTVNR